MADPRAPTPHHWSGARGTPVTASRRLVILGIRGVPAAHGGFETFAERLALHLRDRGWRVTVYCQEQGTGSPWSDRWEGIDRVHIPVAGDNAWSTIAFDIHAARHVVGIDGTILTLGYNTAFLSVWLRLFKRRRSVINMDGVEWKRSKYSFGKRVYLRVMELLAALSATTLIADHPAISERLRRIARADKIRVISYGADAVEDAPTDVLARLGLQPQRYVTLIARPEPENSILEIVQAFSATPRGHKLVVLGGFDRAHPYHRRVLDAAGSEVVFPGSIYGEEAAALRFHALGYMHGHQVGGTNPSLVEALGAGNPVIAHDNRFNRWVAGDAGLFFADAEECAAQIGRLCSDELLRHRLGTAARARWAEAFQWERILSAYEDELRCVANGCRPRTRAFIRLPDQELCPACGGVPEPAVARPRRSATSATPSTASDQPG